jgi:dienelactone hydrolase
MHYVKISVIGWSVPKLECSMRQFIVLNLAMVLAWGAHSVRAQDCNPAAKDAAALKVIRPQFHTVEGPLAEFDPCHSSVKLQKPFFSDKPPLMIVVHGGGGVDMATKNAADAFRSKGFATLLFDAYEHNGFYQGMRFWATQASNEARQKMIYKVTLGAYEWAIQRKEIDTSQIYFHGLSNGGTVVANIAGAVSPEHVKGVFAEGAPGMGLGLPDKLTVPLRLVYGKIDNYGGKTEDDWIWIRQDPCLTNAVAFIHPKGNAQNCNAQVNRLELTPKPIDWFGTQKSQGADIEIWFYDHAAHGIFVGQIQKNMNTYGVDVRRFAWVGADNSARTKLLDDVQKYLKSKL